MKDKAERIYEGYDIPTLQAKIGLTKSRKHFGSSHTVVTYFPLNTLGKISQEEVLSALKGQESINLYVHIPFCKSKCRYCSYVSEPNPSNERIQGYMHSLGEEARKYRDILEGREVQSVYVGGGTPTILSTNLLEEFFGDLQEVANLEGANICVESNPKLSKEKLDTLRRIGLDRLSIGVQSFDDVILKTIGRGYYNKNAVVSAISMAREMGITSVNIDMMQDLPNQSLKSIGRDLETISRLKPDSITWYTMRVAQNCKIHKGCRQIPERESLIARIMITEELKRLGYTQKSGDRFCLSQKSRDTFKEARNSERMLGLGVSAYSHIGNLIFRNEIDIDRYLENIKRGKVPVAMGKVYNKEEEVISQFVLGLKEGLELNDFGKKALVGSLWDNFGYWLRLSPADKTVDLFNWVGYRKKIPELIHQDLLEFKGNRLQFTAKGRLFENEICRMLYSPIVDAETDEKPFLAFFRKFGWDFHTTPLGSKASA